jgi:hypothetical protein
MVAKIVLLVSVISQPMPGIHLAFSWTPVDEVRRHWINKGVYNTLENKRPMSQNYENEESNNVPILRPNGHPAWMNNSI